MRGGRRRHDGRAMVIAGVSLPVDFRYSDSLYLQCKKPRPNEQVAESGARCCGLHGRRRGRGELVAGERRKHPRSRDVGEAPRVVRNLLNLHRRTSVDLADSRDRRHGEQDVSREEDSWRSQLSRRLRHLCTRRPRRRTAVLPRPAFGWNGLPALPGMAQVQERSFGTASGTAQNRRLWEGWVTQRSDRS